MRKKKAIPTKDFDEKFERNEDISEHVDFENMVKRVVLDIPVWAIREIDQEASRRGLARQSLLKTWIIDNIDELKRSHREQM